MENDFWKIAAILTWSILGLFAFLRLTLGKKWPLKMGSRLYFGQGLINAIKKVIKESKQRDLQEDTVAEFAAHVIWRLTRIGIFAALIAAIPLILLWRQNDLIANQNRLFELQNIKIDTQTTLLSQQTKLFNRQNITLDSQNTLFSEQNNNIATQTDLFLDQNRLVRFQNTKIDSQISLAAVQNDRLNLQNNLIEAERRSSLVFLMSNILDKVDEEIKIQRDSISKNKRLNLDSSTYYLSKPLINRIIALSKALKPYKVIEGNDLSELAQSPERGQLFLALMDNNLDSTTQNTIVVNGDFSYGQIGNVNLSNAYLEGARLQFADLRGANFSGARLARAKLDGSILEEADLSNANLRGVDLMNSSLKNAKLENAKLGPFTLKKEESYSIGGLIFASVEFSDLRGVDLRGAILNNTDLSHANLAGADFSFSDLLNANLTMSNLDSITTFNLDQIKQLYSLYEADHLTPELKLQLLKEKPCLFEDPDGPNACK